MRVNHRRVQETLRGEGASPDSPAIFGQDRVSKRNVREQDRFGPRRSWSETASVKPFEASAIDDDAPGSCGRPSK